MSLRYDAPAPCGPVRDRIPPHLEPVLRRCTFVVQDALDLIEHVKDEPAHGIYCDPPFPGAGDNYKHKFTEADHRRLADLLLFFGDVRIVCRFYDHPSVRELYPEPVWEWIRLEGGRKQTNAEGPEVLLVRNGGAQ